MTIGRQLAFALLISCALGTPGVSAEVDKDSHFEETWKLFSDACDRGDYQTLNRLADESFVRRMDGSLLDFYLGEDWKGTKVRMLRRQLVRPHAGYDAVVFLILEVGNEGTQALAAMWWVLHDGKWGYLNLPIEDSLMGPSLTLPQLPTRGTP